MYLIQKMCFFNDDAQNSKKYEINLGNMVITLLDKINGLNIDMNKKSPSIWSYNGSGIIDSRLSAINPKDQYDNPFKDIKNLKNTYRKNYGPKKPLPDSYRLFSPNIPQMNNIHKKNQNFEYNSQVLNKRNESAKESSFGNFDSNIYGSEFINSEELKFREL